MNVQEWLVARGKPAFMYDIATTVTVQNQIQFATVIPTDIAWIYGVSTDADGFDQNNNPLPTTTQLSNLYLFLKDSSHDLLQYLRMSNILNVYAGTPVIRPNVYFPVSIKGNIDTSNSQYFNPTGITPGPGPNPVTIHLKFWYMQKKDYEDFQKEHAYHGK